MGKCWAARPRPRPEADAAPADDAPADDAPADDVPKGPTIDDVAALVQASLDETSAAALRVTAKDAASPTATSPGDDDIAFDGDADPADLPEKPKPKRRKSKKKKKADGDAASPKSPKLKRKGSRRKKKADAAAAEARAAEAEARIAEQAGARGDDRIRNSSRRGPSAPAPDPPAADEKPACGCVEAAGGELLQHHQRAWRDAGPVEQGSSGTSRSSSLHGDIWSRPRSCTGAGV